MCVCEALSVSPIFHFFCCFHFCNFFAAAVRLVGSEEGAWLQLQMHSILHFFSPATCKDNKDFSRLATFCVYFPCWCFFFFLFLTDWLAKRPLNHRCCCFVAHSISWFLVPGSPAKLIAARTCVYIAARKIALDAFAGQTNCRNKSHEKSWKPSLLILAELLLLILRVRLAACAVHISRVVSWVLRPASCLLRPDSCAILGLCIVLLVERLSCPRRPRCWVFFCGCLLFDLRNCNMLAVWLSSTQLLASQVLLRPHPWAPAHTQDNCS